MALTGFLAQGLVSRPGGTRFERSFSCGDLSSNISGNIDPVQLFATLPGKSQSRSLSSDALPTICPKTPAQFGDVLGGIVPCSQESQNDLRGLANDSRSMRFVCSLSDLLQHSPSADSNKQYIISEFPPLSGKRPVHTIPEGFEGLSEDAHLPPLVSSPSRCDESAQEDSLLEDVMEGLVSGHLPQLTEEGTGGTYFLSNPEGRKVAVFKPMDEEPLALNCPRGMTPSRSGEGLKKGTRVGEGAFREVAAHILDYPAEPEESGFAGVPLTFLAECSNEYFHRSTADTEVSSFLEPYAVKLGSLQQFVPAMSNCEDMGPKLFPVHEVHKIAVLDMRLANTDRNGANILVQKDASGFRLTPIDHGYCLPETLEDITFEWLYWQQARSPFDERTLQYILSLDAEEDIERLQQHGWEVNAAVAKTIRICTMLLKKGAVRGLSPYSIGSLMVREDFDRPSTLESIIEEAEAKIDREELSPSLLLQVLSDLLDQELSV